MLCRKNNGSEARQCETERRGILRIRVVIVPPNDESYYKSLAGHDLIEVEHERSGLRSSQYESKNPGSYVLRVDLTPSSEI